MANKVVIIGSGPAGLTAGIYLARAKFDPILIDGMLPGGQLTTTTKIENWPGMTEVFGTKLMMDMKKQAEHCGCKIINDVVEKVDFSVYPYKIFTKNGEEFITQSVIIATGALHKRLNIPGEQEYWGKGVAVCATCDAPFYMNKDVIVVGGGNSGVVEAEHLTHFAKKVIVVHILDKLTATDPIKEKILSNPKVSFIYNSTIVKICGDGQKVQSVLVENVKTKEQEKIKIDGIFIAIGLKPNTEIFNKQLDIDNYGYIVCKNRTFTNKNGIFAAGDVMDFRYKQAITAAGFGCMAALDCQEYLNNKKIY